MASAGAGAAVSELPRRLDHAWRVFGTGLSFVAFGLGGLLLGVLVMPVLLLMRDPVARRRRARRVVQVAFASHLRLMRGLGVMTYEIEGGERLQRDGLLVLANHPTLIDVVCLISLLPNADCVVKRAVACNPFMRGPVRAAGYISNDDGAGLVDDCVAAVHAGGTLVIFPEGTRSVPGQPPRLQRGGRQHRRTGPHRRHPGADHLQPANPDQGTEVVSCPLTSLSRSAADRRRYPDRAFLGRRRLAKGGCLGGTPRYRAPFSLFRPVWRAAPCKHLSTRSRN
nr:lysophospholipid acyltransferase family protein [Stenotrophomonas maltophilia]